MKSVRVQLSAALSAVRTEFGVFQRAYTPYAPLLSSSSSSSPLLSSHPSTRESCSPPSAHSSFRTVSILWRRTEAAGRWQSRAFNARHLDGNPRVKPGETGRALCCDAIPCMLTIREVCTVNRLNVSSQRLQRGLSLDALVMSLKSCVILAFCAAGRSVNKGLLPLLVIFNWV